MKYSSIKIEGSILAADILDKIESGDVSGQKPKDFNLEGNVKVKDEIIRAWTDAQDLWRMFKRKASFLNEQDTGTTETRNHWILPLLGILGYRLEPERSGEIVNGKNFAISHRDHSMGGFPVHVIGCNESLDKKRKISGPRVSPHAMLQEYINLNEHLYAIVSNGYTIRLLRDSTRLIKLSYLEFDMERMMEDELFSDFALMYRLLHATRMPQKQELAGNSIIERYHQDSLESGSRIRDGLSLAVEESIKLFGNGFLSHPDNDSLRQAILDGAITNKNFYHDLLRLIYRLLFLMVIEERKLVFPEETDKEKIDIYYNYYSVHRLRKLAENLHLVDKKHEDYWIALKNTFKLFESEQYGPSLGIAPLDGQLFGTDGIGVLSNCELLNGVLLQCLSMLGYFHVEKTSQRTQVNYSALDVEELGSVYERLLEMNPNINRESFTFELGILAGNERKTTGSYYTPDCLVQNLLNTALDPVLIRAISSNNPEAAILHLKVCDPACGSGHFLIAAANRIARKLCEVRLGGDEPTPLQYRHALRDVISHCIYGVDINPMAVELCKVSLWLEAMEPGKSLTFLDHKIKCGNSLLGATPALIQKGIPDAAFDPIEGDDKEFCNMFKKQNKHDRKAMNDFWGIGLDNIFSKLGNLPASMLYLDDIDDSSIAGNKTKEELYQERVKHYKFCHFLHDAWCAAFVWKKCESQLLYPITEACFRRIEKNPHDCDKWMENEIIQLAQEYQFFHWHIEFPDVFTLPKHGSKLDSQDACWNGGFDCILGNPPWEKINLKDQEFFIKNYPEIAKASSKAVRKKLIEKLAIEDLNYYEEYLISKRYHDGISMFFRNSGYYPMTGVSRINLYSLFCELDINLVNSSGRVGLVIASGIVTDSNNKLLFEKLMSNSRLIHAWDFENSEGIFEEVHRSYKFMLFCAGGTEVKAPETDFAFYLSNVSQLADKTRHFSLNQADLIHLNPESQTCPTFRNVKEAELNKTIYNRVKAWSLHKIASDYPGVPATPFNMSNDSSLFFDINNLTEHKESYFPVYESKFIHQFNHRFAEYNKNNINRIESSSLNTPQHSIIAHYFMRTSDYYTRYNQNWFLVYRMIARATDERTCIASIIPGYPSVNSLSIIKDISPLYSAVQLGEINSYVHDYVARQKVSGTNFNHWIWHQLPLLDKTQINTKCPWTKETLVVWCLRRSIELIYTAWDIEHFARDCGYNGPPFKWDDERRFKIRCELDAAYFYLYGIKRDDIDCIMNTFQIVKRKDEEKYGEYRTKNLILDIYDMMQCAMDTCTEYVSILDPLPGPPVDVNGNFIAFKDWDKNRYPSHIHNQEDGIYHVPEFEQAFPWDGREKFVYDLIPRLVEMKPGRTFEYYQDAAILASLPEKLKVLLSPERRNEFDRMHNIIGKCTFPTATKIRPNYLRKYLVKQEYLFISPTSGIATVPLNKELSKLNCDIAQLLPFIYEAVDVIHNEHQFTLNGLQQNTIDEVKNDIRMLIAV